MTLNKSNLRIYLGVLIFALVVQPNIVPNGLTLKVSKKFWSNAAVYHGMKGGGGENNPVPVLTFLNCDKQNSVSLFEATGQIAKLKNVSLVIT